MRTRPVGSQLLARQSATGATALLGAARDPRLALALAASLARRVLGERDLAAAVVTTGLADRVRSNHRATVGAANELRARERLVDATATALCSADLSLWDCHLSMPSALQRPGANRRARPQHRIVGVDRLRTGGSKSTARRPRCGKCPGGRVPVPARRAPLSPSAPLPAGLLPLHLVPRRPWPRSCPCLGPHQGARHHRRRAALSAV